MRPVPKTWEEFQAYWDHMCRNVLENNWAAREVLEVLSQRLLEVEVVDEAELRSIMGLPPRTKPPAQERVIVTPPVGSPEEDTIAGD